MQFVGDTVNFLKRVTSGLDVVWFRESTSTVMDTPADTAVTFAISDPAEEDTRTKSQEAKSVVLVIFSTIFDPEAGSFVYACVCVCEEKTEYCFTSSELFDPDNVMSALPVTDQSEPSPQNLEIAAFSL